MIIQLKDAPSNYACIYKINYPNNKIYIGQTSDLKRRFWEHNNINKAIFPCDIAIKRYGKITEVEILEQIDDKEKRDEREIYWIKFYNATDRSIGYNLTIGGSVLEGENSPKAIYTNEQVLFIRKSRYEGKKKIEIYRQYFSNYNFNGFENIWLGNGYPNVGREYIIKKNSLSRAEYTSRANRGENNRAAKLTEEMVKEIRQRFHNGEKITDIWQDFDFVSRETIDSICKYRTWKHIKD